MSKFSNKTSTIRITAEEDTFNMVCEECNYLNCIAGSPYALGSHIYKVMIETLRSMSDNKCKTIKITASWE